MKNPTRFYHRCRPINKDPRSSGKALTEKLDKRNSCSTFISKYPCQIVKKKMPPSQCSNQNDSLSGCFHFYHYCRRIRASIPRPTQFGQRPHEKERKKDRQLETALSKKERTATGTENHILGWPYRRPR